jgi:hypothetical protein
MRGASIEAPPADAGAARREEPGAPARETDPGLSSLRHVLLVVPEAGQSGGHEAALLRSLRSLAVSTLDR